MLNFEKIELIGFKSFPDKAKVELQEGITGIVGPNGCGKSNIADAVKWVLGEQSAKTLRGTTMQDVIFNGTAQRKSLSFCEVSLYFNNTNKLFSSLDYQEVVITRKLFRSGESEYMINRQPSRLKDIVQLLHECGVSKSGYSIIEQGKVQEIFNSKPEDRRSIFEEAVGIAKTKQDRKETLAKLQRTQDNIKRVEDIITERERSLNPLKRQAEKTRQYNEIIDQLKYHRINTYIYKYDNASTTKASIQERIDGYVQALETYNKDLEETKELYKRHQDELSTADQTLINLNDEITERAVASEKKTGASNTSQTKLSFFKAENKRLEDEINDANNKIEEDKKSIEQNNSDIDTKNQEIQKINNLSIQLNEKVSTINAKIAAEEESENDVNDEFIKSTENLADSNKRIGELSSEKSVLLKQLDELNEKKNKSSETEQKDIKTYQEDLSNFTKLETELAELQDKASKIEDSIKKANEGADTLNKLINKYNTNIEVNEQRCKIQRELKENFEGYNGAVKFIMNEVKTNADLSKKVKGVVANLISTSKEYEVAIETAIGGALQNIVVDTSVDAEYVINYLKKSEGGRVTILPIKSLKIKDESKELFDAKKESGAFGLARELVNCDSYYNDVVMYLLGNTLVVDTITNARKIADKYYNAFKIVTLDGDIVATSGAMTGGSRKAHEASLISIDRKLNELLEQTTKLNDEKKDYESKYQQLLNISNNGVDKLDEITKDIGLKKELKNELSGKLKLSKEILDRNSAGSSSIVDQIQSINTRLQEIEGEYKAIEEGNSELLKVKDDNKTKQEAAREKNKALRSKREELLSQLNENRNSLISLQNDIASCGESNERAKKEIDDCNEKIEKNTNTIESNKQIIESLVAEIAQNTLSDEERKQLESLRKQRDDFNIRKQELNRLIEKDDFKREMLQSEINKNSENKAELDIKLANVDSELQFMSENIEKDYKLNYESCLQFKDENYNYAESIPIVEEFEAKKERLGNINPNAIEECEQAQKEYDEITTQKEDLVKGKEDLEQVINSLTTQMAETFDEKFKTIRKNFSEIFKELFGGGKADLVIEESETGDPLDAGIEIIAEPPGKKLQRISLLSGGEKSLTAIAILFSILKLRPMPFVIVDEIEAALDDANVERFARYLQNFSNETQFICITHKKVTMEHANALFGVTMPEKGVSSIVSVKLSDAVKIEGVD